MAQKHFRQTKNGRIYHQKTITKDYKGCTSDKREMIPKWISMWDGMLNKENYKYVGILLKSVLYKIIIHSNQWILTKITYLKYWIILINKKIHTLIEEI